MSFKALHDLASLQPFSYHSVPPSVISSCSGLLSVLQKYKAPFLFQALDSLLPLSGTFRPHQVPFHVPSSLNSFFIFQLKNTSSESPPWLLYNHIMPMIFPLLGFFFSSYLKVRDLFPCCLPLLFMHAGCKLHEGRDSHSQLHPQCWDQYLSHRYCDNWLNSIQLISIDWINESISAHDGQEGILTIRKWNMLWKMALQTPQNLLFNKPT